MTSSCCAMDFWLGAEGGVGLCRGTTQMVAPGRCSEFCLPTGGEVRGTSGEADVQLNIDQ